MSDPLTARRCSRTTRKRLRVLSLSVMPFAVAMALMPAPAHAEGGQTFEQWAAQADVPDPTLIRLRAAGTTSYVHDVELITLHARTDGSLMQWTQTYKGWDRTHFRLKAAGSPLCLQRKGADRDGTTVYPAPCNWGNRDQAFRWRVNANGTVSLVGWDPNARVETVRGRNQFVIGRY